jgi:cholesterol oxidase
MGVGDSFHAAPVGVFFDKPGEKAADPYFGGAGPERTGCTECGACMTGCRVGAKNTLMKNYLYLAEQQGAEILPLTTVTGLRQHADGSWAVATKRTGGKLRKGRRTITAGQVVIAAGTWGTQNLLHQMKASTLPKLSDKLGELTRTNSEMIVGSARYRVDRKRNYSNGVAITSSFHPNEHTHIEPVRYGKGSNAMGLLSTWMTDGGPGGPRWLKWLREALKHPLLTMRMFWLRGWSERTIIVLVMQSLDNSLTVRRKRGLLRRERLVTTPGHGEPNPTWIPAGNDVTRALAERIDGYPGGSVGEILDIPMTAHIIGGCPIGDSPATGVIDPWQRLYGYDGLHVIDGAAVTANLGVNPSLTITAQAERAMAFWPNIGEPDPRPALGSSYRPVDPVEPRTPAVPRGAYGELRLPIASV